MKPGIYYDLPMEEYKKIPAVHKSEFQHILKSGKHYQYFLEHGEEEKQQMVFGNLVDTLLFEPDLLKSRYSIIPEEYDDGKGHVKPWNWNATVCKQWREDNFNENPSVSFIKTLEYEQAQSIVEAIQNHPMAREWLSGAKYQVSCVWVDPETGLLCKSRMDAYRESERIVDLKVTNNPLPGAFARIAANFKYHCQGAFYHDGLILATCGSLDDLPSIPFSFVVVEESPPYEVVTYTLGIQSFEVGRIVYRQALNNVSEWRENDEYPGYSNVDEELELPGWLINRVQMEGIIE